MSLYFEDPELNIMTQEKFCDVTALSVKQFVLEGQKLQFALVMVNWGHTYVGWI